MSTMTTAGWVLLTAVLCAFVAWGLTELVNRKWLAPWKAEIKSRGVRPGWWWTGIVATAAVLIGAVAGAVFAEAVVPDPLGDVPIGILIGVAAGAQPAWIVKLAKKRAGQVLRAGGKAGDDAG